MMRSKGIVAIFLAFTPSMSGALGPFDSREAFNSINKAVADVGANTLLESLEQQKRLFSQEEQKLSKKIPSQQDQGRITEIRESKEIVTETQKIIKGIQDPQMNPASSSVPPLKYSLAEYNETIRTTKNPSWVICSGYPWKASDKYDWTSYIDPILNNKSPTLSGVGIFTRYSQGKDGKLRFGDYGATGFIVNTSLVMTNKHVLKRYAFKDETGWHFREGQHLYLSFPVEYSRCKKKSETKLVRVTGIR